MYVHVYTCTGAIKYVHVHNTCISVDICDPLWEKVQFCANEFELCMNIAVQVKLQVYPLFGRKATMILYLAPTVGPTLIRPS